MKKNVMMRVAAMLLVCVMATTCGISGTFAKYVTAGNAHADARVAKWGVRFDNTSDLFKANYEYDNTSKNHFASWTYSVKSEGGNVVAPGTNGNAYNMKTTGTPEVSYIVKFDVDESTLKTIYLLEDEAGNAISYYPVQFTLTIGGNAVTITDRTATSLANAIEGVSYFYEVTTNTYYCRVSDTAPWIACGSTAPVLNLSWNWVFHVDATNDTLDTVLGDLAAGMTIGAITTGDYCLDVSITVNATATQID